MVGKRSKLRVAFIGAGGIAGTHMGYLAEMDDVEMVAVADVVRESAEKRSEEYGMAVAYADYRKMLKEIKPDAVSVCTPNGLHAPCSIAALNSSAHVIVEKPMAMNAREAQRMVDAAKRNRRKLIIGFQYRFDPKTQYIKNAVDSGRLGKVVYARLQTLRRRGIPNWGVFGRKELQGGGPLIDIGVHMMEAAHYVMGSPMPVAASGSTYTYLGNKPSAVKSMWPDWDHKTYTVEDLAVGQIRFANDSTLQIESSFAAHIERNAFNFTVMGEKGGASWDPPGLFADEGGYMTNSTPNWLPSEDAFRTKMRNFVDHLLYGKETMAPGIDGLMVQKMLDGIYASAVKKREVVIK